MKTLARFLQHVKRFPFISLPSNTILNTEFYILILLLKCIPFLKKLFLLFKRDALPNSFQPYFPTKLLLLVAEFSQWASIIISLQIIFKMTSSI